MMIAQVSNPAKELFLQFNFCLELLFCDTVINVAKENGVS